MQTIGRIPADAKAMSSLEAAKESQEPGEMERFSVRRTSSTGTESRISGMMSHQGKQDVM